MAWPFLARIRTSPLPVRDPRLESELMAEPSELEDLVLYVARSSSLELAQARRLVDDIISYLDESPRDFILRRHSALRRAGCSNGEIFAQIAQELERRRFPAPRYTQRQLRRIIYG